jgi:uncharacterized protein (DUF433 family)
MKLPPFLTEVPYGEIRLMGHRIGLFHVIYYHNLGYSPAQLQEEFPSLPRELINDVLAFYENNRAEVQAYMRRCEEEMEQRRATGKALDVEELKQRREAQRRAETA